MITETHDDESLNGGFEQRLLVTLTKIDADRPADEAGAREGRRPIRVFRQIRRPVAFGFLAAFAVGCASGALVMAANPISRPSSSDIGLRPGGFDGGGTVIVQESGGAPLTCSIGQGTPSADGFLTTFNWSCVGANGEKTSIPVGIQTKPQDGFQVAGWTYGTNRRTSLWIGPVKAASDVVVTVDGQPLVTLTAGADGYIWENVTMPAGLSLGTHQLRAVGVAPDGGAFDHSAELTVAADPPNENPPSDAPVQSTGQ